MKTPQDPEPRQKQADSVGERAYAPTLIATAVWYAIPGLLYVVWTLLFAGPGVCDGEPCGRWERIYSGLASAFVWAFPSLALSLLIAVLLRLPAVGWRSASTGTAAAILGAGLTTVILRSVGYDIG
ncbi:MAG: hypothetical protein ACRDXX_13085 [Stackebrandtia sp.]